MPDAELAAALAGGHVLVTPNKRLARALVARHDAAQMRLGATAWPAANALPWSAWLQSLRLDALVAGVLADARPLLAAEASALLWERIVAEEGSLLDPRGAAGAAADAWNLFHAWRNPGESFAAWQHAGIDDDAATFSRWASRYRVMLDERRLLDAAEVADLLATAAADVPAWRNLPVCCAGFLEWSPQQLRLLKALETGGMRIAHIALPPHCGAVPSRCAFDSPEAELAAALGHARTIALTDPDKEIGIVVRDLATRRDAVIAAAEDILCPELAERADADAPRPYDVSLGTGLTEVPIVAVALQLVEWSAGALPMPVVARLLRSPYLPGDAVAWLARARLERGWREAGLQHVTFAAALAALPAGDPLIARWGPLQLPDTGRRAPEAWAWAWRGWLENLGWPGACPPASGEWQSRDAWWRLLGAFAKLESVIGTMGRDDAVATLRAMAARTLFQPEARGARIRILGTLEAAGLSFDSLWITGMAAEQWPPPATPQALLPLTWQRARNVPRADATRSLAFAQAVTAALAQAAPEVIASYAERDNDARSALSSLVADWPQRVGMVPGYGGRMRDMAAARPVLESVGDAIAPVLPVGAPVAGGVAVVESQSTCPFQAFARHRLRQRPWPEIAAGLLPEERGQILHRALAAFWEGVGSHAALLALTPPDLELRLSSAVGLGLAALEARRWRAIPAPVAAAEADRLGSVMRAWLDGVERPRPAFRVDARELPSTLNLGDLAFALRIDRVDVLDDGGRAVIDYKAGRAVAPGRWFAARPAGTQLGLYTLALDADPVSSPVRAVAFGQMKAGAVKVVGLAADAQAWPGLSLPAGPRMRLPVTEWEGVIEFWQYEYGALATAFRNGQASVAPRDAVACRYCEMQSLCRIQRLEDPLVAMADGDGGDDDDGA